MERWKLTNSCTTALAEAAPRAFAESDTILLSERDQAIFFDALINPPAPSDRLRRAFADHRRRVVR